MDRRSPMPNDLAAATLSKCFRRSTQRHESRLARRLGRHLAPLLLAITASGVVPTISVLNTSAPTASAQTADSDDDRVDAFAPLDYSRRSKLERAERFLRDENFDDALPLLAALLDNDAEDYFLDTLGGLSLKRHIHELLAALSEKGHDAWEAFYGAAARHTLVEGLASGSVENIEEVVRRYPYTSSAATAGMLLGRRAFDAGRPLAAAIYFDDVRRCRSAAKHEPALSIALSLAWARAGDEAKSADALFDLRRRFNGGVTIRGSDVALPSHRDDVAHWLAEHFGPQRGLAPLAEDWAIFRGNPARNQLGSGAEPLPRRRWRAAAYIDPAEEAELMRLDRQYVAQGKAVVPAAVPVATSYIDATGRAADVVLVRTLRHLLAVDLATGRVVWETETTSADVAIGGDREEIDDVTPTPGERLASD
ncbi:MAG: hypothetical protein WD875_07935, partial [Pirellulales bacterium]